MNKEEFLQQLKLLKINYTEEMLKKLDLFYELLIEWNKKINLTAITSYEEVYLKHFYDSLTLAKVIDLDKNLKLCDVGTGAGFPGIVLKIFFPKLEITLIDSLKKRVDYLNMVINSLNLQGIKAIHERMEDYSLVNEEQFDIITARAVANMNILLEICIKSLKINGKLVLMKANCEEEILNSKKVQKELMCQIEKIEKFTLPKENSHRTLIVINKNSKTPSKYPRRMDKIRKNSI